MLIYGKKILIETIKDSLAQGAPFVVAKYFCLPLPPVFSYRRPGVAKTEFRTRFHGPPTFAVMGGKIIDEGAIGAACPNTIGHIIALEDSASQPIFIETLPKRGYRFIGKITEDEKQLPTEPVQLKSIFRSRAHAAVAASFRLVLAAAFSVALTGSFISDDFSNDRSAAPEPVKRAVEAYLEGQRALAENSKESVIVASIRFRETVALDPEFSKVRAGLARSLYLAAAADEVELVEAAIEDALSADPENADLDLLKGRALWAFQHNWLAARDSFEKALTLNPGAVDARMSLAKFHVLRGENELAVQMVRDARAVNPQALTARGDAGWVMYLLGENAVSKDHCAESALLAPVSIATARCFLDIYLAERGYPRAAQAAISYMRSLGATEAEIANVERGDPKTVIEEFSNWEIEKISGGNLRNSPKRIIKAMSLTYLGRHDEAILAINESMENRDFFFPFVAMLPELAPLYNRPEFGDIRMKLELTGTFAKAVKS